MESNPYGRVFSIDIVEIILEIFGQFKIWNHYWLHFTITIDCNNYFRTVYGYRTILFTGYVFKVAKLPIMGRAIRINVYCLANINIFIL